MDEACLAAVLAQALVGVVLQLLDHASLPFDLADLEGIDPLGVHLGQIPAALGLLALVGDHRAELAGAGVVGEFLQAVGREQVDHVLQTFVAILADELLPLGRTETLDTLDAVRRVADQRLVDGHELGVERPVLVLADDAVDPHLHVGAVLVDAVEHRHVAVVGTDHDVFFQILGEEGDHIISLDHLLAGGDRSHVEPLALDHVDELVELDVDFFGALAAVGLVLRVDAQAHGLRAHAFEHHDGVDRLGAGLLHHAGQHVDGAFVAMLCAVDPDLLAGLLRVRDLIAELCVLADKQGTPEDRRHVQYEFHD